MRFTFKGELHIEVKPKGVRRFAALLLVLLALV